MFCCCCCCCCFVAAAAVVVLSLVNYSNALYRKRLDVQEELSGDFILYLNTRDFNIKKIESKNYLFNNALYTFYYIYLKAYGKHHTDNDGCKASV